MYADDLLIYLTESRTTCFGFICAGFSSLCISAVKGDFYAAVAKYKIDVVVVDSGK